MLGIKQDVWDIFIDVYVVRMAASDNVIERQETVWRRIGGIIIGFPGEQVRNTVD
jgi:hypothetical protein